jgi:hypothetical protein
MRHGGTLSRSGRDSSRNASPVSHWTVRLSSNDRVVIAERLSPGGETQLQEELGTLVERINADADALSARQLDEWASPR